LNIVITVDSHLRFATAKLLKQDKECFVEIQKRFRYSNPEFYKIQRMGWSTRGIRKIINSYTIDKRKPETMVLARGCLKPLRAIFKKSGHKVKLVDNRISFPPIVFEDKITLRDEQEEPVKAILKKMQGCVRGPCSAGKTVILLKAIAEAKQPTMVVVWETTHQKHWIEEIQKFFNIPLEEIGGVGGIFSDRKAWNTTFPKEKFPGRRFGIINVCMQQSMKNKGNLDFFVDRIGFVGGDEIQRFAAKTFQDVVNNFPAKYRIGVSANERRKDGKHFLIHDTFGQVIHELDDKDVGSRRPARVFKVPTKFHSEIYSEDKTKHGELLNDMAEDVDRNRLILRHVKRSIKKNKLCLVLVERKIQALHFLFALKGYSTGLIVGNTAQKEIRGASWLPEWKQFMYDFDHNKEFKRVKKRGEQRKLDVIIGTQKANVGINIRTIDHTFITTPTAKNLELFNQQKGRGERDHDEAMIEQFGEKATPHTYYFWDVMHEDLQKAGNRLDKKYPGTSILRLK